MKTERCTKCNNVGSLYDLIFEKSKSLDLKYCPEHYKKYFYCLGCNKNFLKAAD